MKKAFRALWLLIRVSVKESPWQSLLCLGEPAAGMLELLRPLFLAWMVAGVIDHDASEVVAATVGFVASVGVWLTINMIGIDARNRQLERVGFAFDARIGHITASLPTTDHLQSSRYLDEMQLLRDQQGALGLAFNAFVNSATNVVYVVGTVALAISSDWRLILVAVASVPAMVATRWAVAWAAQAEKASASPGRLAHHLRDLGLSPSAGAEVRVFQLEQTLHDRLRAATADWRAPGVRLARRQGALDVLGTVIFFGTAIAVLGWMIHDVTTGALRIDRVVLALMLIGRLQATSGLVQRSIHDISSTIRTASRFVWLLDYQQQLLAHRAGGRRPPETMDSGIRISNLTYSYPGATAPVLDDVTIDLPAGSVIALIGENGAGKSTLVKLLTGMHRPTGGRIAVDGIDLEDLDLDAWRARLSGGFQDYARFEFAAGETIGIGDLPHRDDEARIRRALVMGTGTEIIDQLPQRLETQLGSQWPDGVDLSGGQWQRLAISRAMMRTAPLLLVLDEPTAALDATTEHELFERYTRAAREAGRHGGVTLLITHRFSTATAADSIVVLDRGKVIEFGTHAELLARGGQYAELYQLQARGYR